MADHVFTLSFNATQEKCLEHYAIETLNVSTGSLSAGLVHLQQLGGNWLEAKERIVQERTPFVVVDWDDQIADAKVQLALRTPTGGAT